MGSLQVACTVKRIDQANDLAICEMAAKSSAAPIKLAATDPQPGATVFALGNPRGLDKTISQGLFTGLRELNGRRVAQVSAAISPGSSGGPVLNSEGELVGVAVATLTGGQTLNFAVPLNTVRDFLAGKQSAADSASLVNAAKALASQRDALTYDEPKWKELDAKLVETLSNVISTTSDVAVLAQVREVAGWYHLDIQADAARKAIQVTKVPTREMFRELANAVWMATDRTGPSAPLEEAEKAAARAVTMGRGLIGSDLSLLADIQSQAGKTQDALSNYLKASTMVPGESEEAASIYMSLFRATKELKRNAEAESWFKKASAVSERPAWDMAEYGRFLDSLLRYDEAGAAWMAASRKAPKSYSYICEAGASYYYARNVEQALPANRRCIELASGKNSTAQISHAHRLLSDMLHDRGVYDEAANHAREAIALQPENGSAHYYLAQALVGQRRFTEAITSAKAAIRLTDGRFGSMHFTLGAAHFRLEQWPEAVQAFTKAAELSPDDPASAYNVAVSLYNSRYYREAIRWYRETLRRDPNRPDKTEILRMIDELSKR
jgi:tetratricopeptide (TPR) repeat protein